MSDRVEPLSADALLHCEAFVVRLARELLQDRHAAEDVAQETMLAALEHPRRIDHWRGWLRAVVRNFARMERRAVERRSAREHAAAVPEVLPSTDEIAARLEMHRCIVEEVLALAEPCRAVILLRYFEDLPPGAIGKRLALPVETVKTRLKRGRAALRQRLEQRFGTSGSGLASVLVVAAHGSRAIPVGASAVGSLLTVESLLGVLAMTTPTKIVLAAGFIAALAGAGWLAGRAHESATPIAASTRASTLPAPEPVTMSEPVRTAALPETDEVAEGTAATEEIEPDEHVRLHGIVVDEAGRPIAQAEIAVDENQGAFTLGAERLLAQTTSGRDGTFSIDRLPLYGREPEIRMSARRDGYAVGGIGVNFRLQQPREPLRIVLGPATVLTGRVHARDGAGIADAVVEPWWFTFRESGESRKPHGFTLSARESVRLSVTTDANGEFRVDGLPFGGTHLLVRASGFVTVERDFPLKADVKATPVDIALVPGGAEIAGRVVFETTLAPAPGVLVGVREQGNSPWWWMRSETDEQGCFRIGGLSRGRWSAFVLGPKSLTDDWSAVSIDDLDLAEGGMHNDVALVLTKGGELVVRVLDAESQAPLSGVRIDMESRPQSSADRVRPLTDVHGEAHWRIPPGVAFPTVRPGVGLTEGFRSSHGPLTRSVEITAGQTTEVVFALERAATVRGIVVDEQGRPVAGAEVVRLDRTPDWSSLSRANVVSDADGHFALSGFAPDAPRVLGASAYVLHAGDVPPAEDGGYGLPEPMVLDPGSAESGRDVTLVLRKRPHTKLTGRLLYGDGKPVLARVKIEEELIKGSMVPASSEPMGDGRCTSFNGRFYLFGPWPGHRYRVSATAAASDGHGTVSVTSNQLQAEPDRDLDFGDLVLKSP